MDSFLTILFDHEYPFTLFLAFLLTVIPCGKKRFSYLLYAVGFALGETYWHFRPLDDVYSYLLFFLFLLVLAILTMKTGFFECLAFVTLAFCLQHLSYKITMSIAEAFLPNIVNTGLYFALYIPIVFLVDAFFFAYILFKRRKGLSFRVNSLLTLVLALIVLGCNILISYYTQEILIETSPYLFATVSLLSIFLCLCCITLIFANSRSLSLEQDNKTLEMLLEKDKQKYEFAKITAENINIHYHDLKQQIRKQGIDKGEIEEIQEQGKRQESLFYTGNKPLDVLLFEKNLICQKKNIALVFLGDGSLISAMKANHVYSLFGNLIDNAIEGLENIQKDRRILLEIRKVKESVLILVENKTAHALSRDRKGDILTTKTEENHGYGIKSINNIATLYDGKTLFAVENNYFRAKIVFPSSSLVPSLKESLTQGLSS